MLIPFEKVKEILSLHKITVTGVFHLGAHECEELPFYNSLGVTNENVIWLDAISDKVEQATKRGIPNVYHAVVSDVDDAMVTFNISNNGQSSSLLEFGTHATEHPHVVYIDKIIQKSITINTFVERHRVNMSWCNFWNFDIQGAELIALKGATKYIHHAEAIYLEVNEKELYKGCGLINEIDDFLAQYNFKRVIKNITEHGWGDALYINTNYNKYVKYKMNLL